MYDRTTLDTTRERVLEGLPIVDERVTLAGIPTAVLVGGSGPPIVMLHGQGEFGATWLRTFAGLVDKHRLIVPDLPGHGASELGAGALDRERIMLWLDALIDHYCDEPPDLAGHLLGGAIAARFASAHAGRIRSLVLVDSLGLSWYRPSPRFALAMIHFVARPTPRTQDKLFRGCMLDLDTLRTDMDGRMELLEAYALERAKTPALNVALRRLMPRLGVPPVGDADLARIDVPTTLIWGRDDLQVRLSTAQAASQRFGWPLHVIDGARDDPAVEQPVSFMQALGHALERPRGAVAGVTP